MRFDKNIAVLAIGALSALPSLAQTSNSSFTCDRSYGFRADVNSVAGTTICSSDAQSFLDAVENFNLSNNSYTQTSQATAFGRFNDVDLVMSYAQNSRQLNYNFVQLNESGSFTGVTRDDSEEQFVDFLKKSDILGRLLRYQSQHSPTSAITGVGGAIPMAGAQDFAASFDTMSKIGMAANGKPEGNNLIGVGLSYGQYSVSGSADKVKTTNLPLTYTIRNDIDPRRQLVLSMPITQVSVGSSSSYHGGIGGAYRLPMNDNWTITPGAKYSVVASKDRATVATVASANIMSTYAMQMDGWDLGIGNMIGYYKTGNFHAGDYSVNPDVKLTMARNGVMASVPTTAFGSKMAWEVSLIDTRYVGGDKPFMDNTQEIGVTIGTNRNATNARSFVRAGLTYFRGNSTNGFSGNIGYWF